MNGFVGSPQNLLQREAFIALAVAAVLATTVLWPTVFLGRVPVPADAAGRVEPWRSEAPDLRAPETLWNPLMTDSLWQVVPEGIAAHRLWSEGLPLWEPNLACGVPALAQGRMYTNPSFNLIARITGPLRAIGWTTLLQLTVALWGGYLFVRQLGAVPAAAAIAAVAFGLNLYLVIWLPHVSFFGAMVWLPLVFFCYERSLATRTVSWAALGAVVFAIQILEGHLPTPFFGGITLGLWSVVRGLAEARTNRNLTRLLRPIVTAGALLISGGLLVAPQLLASMELFLQSPRGQAIGANSTVAFEQGLRIVVPWFWGYRFHGGTYVGPFNVAELGLYFGVVPLALIVVAPLTSRRLEAWFFSTMAIVCGLVVFDIPLVRTVVSWIFPIVFNSFPGRIFAIVALCGSVAAGLGAHWLLAESTDYARRRWEVAVLFFALSAWVAAGWIVVVHRPRVIAGFGDAQWVVWLEELRARGLVWAGIWAAMAAVVMILVRRDWPKRRRLAWLLVVVAAVDLVHAGAGTIPFFSPDEIVPRTSTISRLTQLVSGSGHQARILPLPTQQMIAGELPTIFELPSVTTYSSWPLTRYDRYASLTGVRYLRWPYVYFDDCCTRLMSGLGARFVVAPADLEPRSLQRGDGLRLLQNGAVRIWENLDALPRARLVHDIRWVPPRDLDAVVEILGSPGFSLRNAAVLEGDAVERDPPGVIEPMQTARIVRDLPTVVEVEVEAESSGALVLADSWYPGWRATVDGSPAEVVPADLALRAVLVPAGRSTVVFRYRPAWLVPGILLSLLAAACLIWAVAYRNHG